MKSSRTIHLGQLPSHTHIKRRKIVTQVDDGATTTTSTTTPANESMNSVDSLEPSLKKRRVEDNDDTSAGSTMPRAMKPSSLHDLDEDEDRSQHQPRHDDVASSSSSSSESDDEEDEEDELEQLRQEKSKLAKIQQRRQQQQDGSLNKNTGSVGGEGGDEVVLPQRLLSSFQQDVLFRRNVAVPTAQAIQAKKPTNQVQNSAVHKQFLSNFFK